MHSPSGCSMHPVMLFHIVGDMGEFGNRSSVGLSAVGSGQSVLSLDHIAPWLGGHTVLCQAISKFDYRL